MTEPDPTEVEQYKVLWTTHRNDWLLVLDDDDADLLPINISREHPEAKVFTDDGLAAAVGRRMQEAGIPAATWDEMTRAHQRRRRGPQ